MVEPTVSYIDNGKKGRIAILAFVLTLSVFIIRAMELIDTNNSLHIVAVSLGYFLVSYIGLVWAFRFQLNKTSLLLIIPQSAFFTMAQMAFVMLFFFRDFERVYEFFLLFLLLIVIFITTYVSFLMANIFNVAAFKQIPLVQVARTTSYILTVLVVYFTTFAVLSLQLPLVGIIIPLFLCFFSIVFFHINHFIMEMKTRARSSLLIAVSMLGMTLGTVFLGNRFELSALIPVTVVFVMLGIEMNSSKHNENLKITTKVQYVALVSFVILLNTLFQ